MRSKINLKAIIMRKIIFKSLTLLVLLSFVASCATIFTGTKDTIRFNSNPEGATVYIDGIEVCKTPCSVPVKRSISDKDIEFKLDGYKTRMFTLDKEFNVVSVINLGFLVGWAIDAATGSIMKYDRKSYELDLEKDNTRAFMNPHKIEIDTENKSVNVYVQK